jgi:hypothetical protein
MTYKDLFGCLMLPAWCVAFVLMGLVEWMTGANREWQTRAG